MNTPIVMGPDGKPQFVGKEDPNNTPIQPRSSSKIDCPVCHAQVDYLLGENAYGGVQGCEGCWKRPTQEPQKEEEKHLEETYDTTKV